MATRMPKQKAKARAQRGAARTAMAAYQRSNAADQRDWINDYEEERAALQVQSNEYHVTEVCNA